MSTDNKKARRPKIAAIVKEQSTLIDWLGLPRDEVARMCWGCRNSNPSGLARAHLSPHRHGRNDHPSNFVLLCHSCHFEQPDDQRLELQLLWLKHQDSHAERLRRMTAIFLRAVEAGDVDHESLARLIADPMDRPR